MGGYWRWEPAKIPSLGGRDQEAGGHWRGGGGTGMPRLSLDSGQRHHETGGQMEARWAVGIAQPQDKTCHTLALPCRGPPTAKVSRSSGPHPRTPAQTRQASPERDPRRGQILQPPRHRPDL